MLKSSRRPELHFDGRPVTLHWAADGTAVDLLDGCLLLLDRPSRTGAQPHEDTGGEAVVARSRAGAVVQTTVGRPSKGAPILLLEAMKMEIQIKAPAGGALRRVFVRGQTVEKIRCWQKIGD